MRERDELGRFAPTFPRWYLETCRCKACDMARDWVNDKDRVRTSKQWRSVDWYVRTQRYLPGFDVAMQRARVRASQITCRHCDTPQHSVMSPNNTFVAVFDEDGNGTQVPVGMCAKCYSAYTDDGIGAIRICVHCGIDVHDLAGCVPVRYGPSHVESVLCPECRDSAYHLCALCHEGTYVVRGARSGSSNSMFLISMSDNTSVWSMGSWSGERPIPRGSITTCIDCSGHVRRCGICRTHGFDVSVDDPYNLPLPIISTIRDTNDRRSYVCSNCTEAGHHVCQTCGSLCPESEPVNPCPRCMDRCIQFYSTKPRWTIHCTSKERPGTSVTMGAEVEVEVPSHADPNLVAYNALRVANRSQVFALCKRDATITRGFEFVTYPFTWNWLRENEQFIKDVFKVFADYGTHGNYRNCGLHVHVSRKHAKRTKLYKLLRLLYADPVFTRHIAGRYGVGAAAFNDTPSMMVVKARADGNEGYRNAVYCTPNNTVEFRLFAGAIDADDFLRKIETTQALLDYASICSIGAATPAGFVDFADRHRRTYKRLINHLENGKTQTYPGEKPKNPRPRVTIATDGTRTGHMSHMSNEEWDRIVNLFSQAQRDRGA